MKIISKIVLKDDDGELEGNNTNSAQKTPCSPISNIKL